MSVQLQGNSGVLAEVQGTGLHALNVVPRPLDYTNGSITGGHYRATMRINSIAAQAASARILELRNTSATMVIVPTRLLIRALQTVAGTAQENSVDVYRVTNFSAIDTTNATAVTPTVKKSSGMTASASAAGQLRAMLTANTAGMTGGTLTKDPQPIATLPYNVAAAINTTTVWGPLDCFDDVNGTHPVVLVQNEGIEVENRVLNVTSYGITWYIDLSWTEMPSSFF